MKMIKTLLAVIALVTISLNIAKADVTDISKSSDLTKQYKQEIKDKLNLPVFLKFEDKNLKGFATAYIEVLPSGKLHLVKVEGDNNSLNDFISSKINSINAWTGKEFAGKTFRYIINLN